MPTGPRITSGSVGLVVPPSARTSSACEPCGAGGTVNRTSSEPGCSTAASTPPTKTRAPSRFRPRTMTTPPMAARRGEKSVTIGAGTRSRVSVDVTTDSPLSRLRVPARAPTGTTTVSRSPVEAAALASTPPPKVTTLLCARRAKPRPRSVMGTPRARAAWAEAREAQRLSGDRC
jgi:hypothetical protein